MNRKIRVLHVAQAAGGVDRYIQMLLKYMNKEKYENIFVCSQDFKKEDYVGLISSFEQIEMHRAISINDLKVLFKVQRLIKYYNPDIVYAHSSKAGVIARMANIGKKNVCIYNPHGWAFNMRTSKKKRFMYTIFEKISAPFCKKIVCISESEKQSALENKICNKNKLQVIFNGIDIDAFEKSQPGLITRNDLNIPESAFIVGMIGRISEQKAPDIFIKAARLIKRKIPSSYFIIVGDGEMESYVKKYAEDNDFSDSLYITGWVNNPLSYAELFDVATLLSRWEGFGLVLPEYMMLEKPIIASNVDAIPNIIKDNENGLLIKVDDVEEVYRAVLKVYNNREMCQRFVEQGRKEVYEKFNVRRVALEHEELFLGISRRN